VAAAYERFRPGYPDSLVDDVLEYAGRQVRTALEIGAGTGKATRVFAARGIAVTASDPDPAMLAELRRHVPAGVATVEAGLEDLPLDLPPRAGFDLVYAAAALHWTRPEGRWERVAALLGGSGVFASFGGEAHLADADLEQAVRAARAPYLRDDDVPSPDGTTEDDPLQWPGTELLRTALFTDVRQSTIERRATLSARDYVGHLSTISAYVVLPDQVRQQVLDQILQVLPGRVELRADVTLHLARRTA
jgi:SAM-dependent methyltransferase